MSSGRVTDGPRSLGRASALLSRCLVAIPAGNFLASPLSQTYTNAAGLGAMDPSTLASVGGSQAHQNMQPFLVLNFSIALQGIFPSQN